MPTPDAYLIAFVTILAVVFANWLQGLAHKREARNLWDRLLFTLTEHPLHSHDEEKGSGEPLTETKLRYPKKPIVNGEDRH